MPTDVAVIVKYPSESILKLENSAIPFVDCIEEIPERTPDDKEIITVYCETEFSK